MKGIPTIKEAKEKLLNAIVGKSTIEQTEDEKLIDLLWKIKEGELHPTTAYKNIKELKSDINKEKLLADHLNIYIKDRHSQQECIGFIDGFEKALDI